jgi:hypothetical protein
MMADMPDGRSIFGPRTYVEEFSTRRKWRVIILVVPVFRRENNRSSSEEIPIKMVENK